MAIENIGPNIWAASQDLSLPGFGNIGARMTIIRLKSGEIMLISPIKISEWVAKEIFSLGDVKILVAPNGIHHLFMGAALYRFPHAKLFGPRALAKKRKDLVFTEFLLPGETYPWSSDVEQIGVAAHGGVGEEFLFFHKESKTLVMTDLAFNLTNDVSFVEKVARKINNAYDRFGITRLGQLAFTRKGIQKATKKVLEWRPEKIIVAHGEIVRENGLGVFKDAFERYL